MVAESILTRNLLKVLEKYMIAKAGYNLHGSYNYDLILLIPSDRFDYDTKYSLLISSEKFDSMNSLELTKDILLFMQDHLNPSEYNAITRMNFIHSSDPIVKNWKYGINDVEMVTRLRDIIFGGVELDYGVAIRTSLNKLVEFEYSLKKSIELESNLDKLIENHARKFYTINGECILAGIKRIDKNFIIYYYTGKGLREMWDNGRMTDEEKKKAAFLKEKDEAYLIENEYLAAIPLDDIEKVM